MGDSEPEDYEPLTLDELERIVKNPEREIGIASKFDDDNPPDKWLYTISDADQREAPNVPIAKILKDRVNKVEAHTYVNFLIVQRDGGKGKIKTQPWPEDLPRFYCSVCGGKMKMYRNFKGKYVECPACRKRRKKERYEARKHGGAL